MSMILLAVEDASRDAPIRDFLIAEGWWVTTVTSKEEALRAAADHAPQLMILDRGMDDPASLLKVFSRASGGCGVLVLVDSLVEEAAGDVGDGIVARDQEAEDLVAKVRGSLDAPRATQGAPAVEGQLASADEQLTARELFGDILVDLGETGVVEETAGESTMVLDSTMVEEPSAPEPEVDAAVQETAPEDEDLDAEAEAEGTEDETSEAVIEAASELSDSDDAAETEPGTLEDDAVEEEIEAEPATTEGIHDPAPPPTELDLNVDEPPTDEGLSIDEVLAVEESVAEAEAAVDSEAEVEGAETEPESAEPAEALERVGPYELLELAELGDLTERWLARRAGGDGERVVLERVRNELRNRADVRDAFVEGYSDAAGWEHENVLAVVDLGRDGDVDYVATEYHPGHSLREVLDRVARMEARMPLGVSLLLIERIAAALEALAEGPTAPGHGWLVPGSVWLSDNGDVLLREFGLGRLPVSDTTLLRDWTEHRFGAPEKWSDKDDMRSDLYSLGAVLYEMVSGQAVHTAMDLETLVEAIRGEDISPAQQVDPTIPSEIDAWVMRLLRRSPEERPQSVQEVMAKIDLALQALPARPASAELNAYVRQLFAASVPESPASVASVAQDEAPIVEASPEVETDETPSRRWDWWWLLIPLLALLSAFVGWKLLSGNKDVARFMERPSARVELAAAPPDSTNPLRHRLQ